MIPITQEKSGSTLVVMLVLMAVLAGFAAITIDYTQRVAHYSRSLNTAASSESPHRRHLSLYRQFRRREDRSSNLTIGIRTKLLSLAIPTPTDLTH
jgi:hypothetical protein